MRLFKLASIAAGVCLLAAWSARAQVTNHVTLSGVAIIQGASTNNGINTTYSQPKTDAANNARLLQDIGAAVNANGTGTFTSPKLVLITGNGGASFAVIDGANFYDLSSNPGGSNIMNISTPLEIQITSGMQSDSSVQEKKTQRIPITIVYDDTASSTGNQLTFTLNGLVTVSETRTAPNGNNIYTDTVKGKISMMGAGSRKGSPFVLTANFVFGGSAQLPAL